jgi:hypothetical protein
MQQVRFVVVFRYFVLDLLLCFETHLKWQLPRSGLWSQQCQTVAHDEGEVA